MQAFGLLLYTTCIKDELCGKGDTVPWGNMVVLDKDK